MPTFVQNTLASQFPHLPFAFEADLFVGEVSGKSVFTQIASRKIGFVTIIQPKKDPEKRGSEKVEPNSLQVESNGKFDVHLFGDFCNDGDLLRAFGYQLACTFEYELSVNPPRKLTFEGQENEFHHFCEAFCERWVQQVPMAEAIRVIRNF
ncbi:MAG: hypothetical protein AAB381_01725 [Patescibacteria group bacterium]